MAAEIEEKRERAAHEGQPASMRPRRMAAEISGRTTRTRGPTRFNEAAANGRGNLKRLGLITHGRE